MGNAQHFLLLRGIKSVLCCDDAEVVRGIARYVVSQHLGLRLVSALVEKTRDTPIPSVVALIGWLKSFLSVSKPDRSDGTAWIARLSNERLVIEKLVKLSPDLGWNELKFRSLPQPASVAPLWNRGGQSPSHKKGASDIRRVFRIARLLHRRCDFFKVLRVVELVGYYMRYLAVFTSADFDVAVMSSHSNPHGIAFNQAARKCGLPTVLITHGMPVRPVARLSFNLAVIHCEAARQTYLDGGCELGRVLIHGRLQDHQPMPADLAKKLVVGIFLCKDVREGNLAALIDRLVSEPRVSRIIIRPHPKNLWAWLDTWIASRNDSRISRTGGRSVLQDVAATDLVLAGNSSVLVDAVVAGRPAGYVPGLDHGSLDLHQFAASGLIFPVEEDSELDLEAMLRFYQRADWPIILGRFANVEEEELAVMNRAVDIMRALIAPFDAGEFTGAATPATLPVPLPTILDSLPSHQR
ncbi:MAG: hypothetical protein AABM67_18405 [Acidobacteriota bacterium]